MALKPYGVTDTTAAVADVKRPAVMALVATASSSLDVVAELLDATKSLAGSSRFAGLNRAAAVLVVREAVVASSAAVRCWIMSR